MSSITSTGAGPSSGAGLPAVPDLGHRARPGEAFIKGVLMASAYLSVAVTVGIVVALIRPVIAFFREVPFGDFFATEGRFAVLPLVAATAHGHRDRSSRRRPLGLGAAMYLSEYASRRARKYLKPTVELLAGVPSVVYGFFAADLHHPDAAAGHLEHGRRVHQRPGGRSRARA